MEKKPNLVTQFLTEHQTVASILTIVLAVAAINNWMISDIRADTRETNKRIDALYHYVLTKQSIGPGEISSHP